MEGPRSYEKILFTSRSKQREVGKVLPKIAAVGGRKLVCLHLGVSRDKEVRDQMLTWTTRPAIGLERATGKPGRLTLNGIEPCPEVIQHRLKLTLFREGGSKLRVDDFAND